MLPKEYGSGSTCHRRFQEWTVSKVFQKLWVRLLKVYDDLRGIRWTWSQMRPSRFHLTALFDGTQSP